MNHGGFNDAGAARQTVQADVQHPDIATGGMPTAVATRRRFPPAKNLLSLTSRMLTYDWIPPAADRLLPLDCSKIYTSLK